MSYDAVPYHRHGTRGRGGLTAWSSAVAEPAPGAPSTAEAAPVVIDCDTCSARGLGCGDCVVTVLLGGPPVGVTLNDEERRAVEVLAAAGLIPPLRLAYGVDSPFLDQV